jgi:thiamine-phosphate pyrophosphorylase
MWANFTPAEQLDVFRILDASSNRAREALRVIEDYCRFTLEDAFLTGELKTIRHTLTEALAGLHGQVVLSARDTIQDVGATLTTPQERERYSLVAVAQANLKRLQEALRSLEEFSKLQDSVVAQTLEQLRYRSYTLEKAIILGTTARRRLADARLYLLVTPAQCPGSLEWTVSEAAAGGAQIIQLREKCLPDRALLDLARKVRTCTRKAGVLFIMNDRPDLARLAEADGVHLGQGDLSVHEARRIIGPDALVGVSTHDLQQCRQAVLEGACYLGVGPTFPSTTKTFAQFAGLEFVREVSKETSLPAFVIGGVTLDNLPAAIAAGARRVAVSGSICHSQDPRTVAARFRHQLDHSQ